VLIPPSVTLIVYGILTETSIGRLFLAGIIPGLLIACSFVATLYTWCRINPALGPAGERSGWPARLRSLGPIVWVLLVFLLVVGGLMKGFFTPTEAGSVGSFAVLLLTAAKRDMTPRRFGKAVLDALRIATMVITLIAGATIMGHFFVVTRIPATVADWLGGLDLPRFVVMLIIVAVYLIGGSFIEDLAFLILATPIFLPLVLKMGYDPVWFGVIVSVVTMIGIILPPVAINAFVVAGVTGTPVGTIYRGIYPHILGMAVCLVILLLVPGISLWLPDTFMK
jgi:tripartite ATP-independent transporter DctM subunit